jgi:hypothetical protein
LYHIIRIWTALPAAALLDELEAGALVAGAAVGAVVGATLLLALEATLLELLDAGALVAGTAVGGTVVGATVGGTGVGAGAHAETTTTARRARATINSSFFIGWFPLTMIEVGWIGAD